MRISGIGYFSHIEVNTEMMVSRKERVAGGIKILENVAIPSLIQRYLFSSVVKSQ